MQRKYDETYRARAIQLINGLGAPKALEQLGLGKGKLSMLYRWRIEAKQATTNGDIEKAIVKHTKKAVIKTEKFLNTFEMCAKVPEGGIILKLTDNGGMLGTLYVTQTGMRFAKANAKLKPTRELSWETFNALMLSGLLS